MMLLVFQVLWNACDVPIQTLQRASTVMPVEYTVVDRRVDPEVRGGRRIRDAFDQCF